MALDTTWLGTSLDFALTDGRWWGVQITWEDLKAAEEAVGEFGGDNRAGVQGTLHRISALRNRKGTVVGLTCRVGRAVTGHMDMIRDMIEGGRCSLCAICHLEHIQSPTAPSATALSRLQSCSMRLQMVL